MVVYREYETVERRRTGIGRILLILAILAALVVGLLFATGFWTADVREGAAPKINLSVEGGKMPAVDVDSKKVVVGTKKETVDVPTVGVKDDQEK